MVLRLPGVGAPTTCAPRPADGIGARPPSTAPPGVGGERGAACGAGGGAGCSEGCSEGEGCAAAGRGAGAASGAWLSAALRFPNTLPYSRYQLLRLSMI